MLFRWRSSSLFFGALVFFIFFFVLRNDSLKAILIRPGGGYQVYPEVVFDELLEGELLKEFKAFYDGLKKSTGQGAIYTPNLKDFDTDASIMDQIRHPNALRSPAIAAPYSPVPAKSYRPQYVLQDKGHWELIHSAKFERCGSPWSNSGISDDIRTFVGHPKGFPSPAFGDRDVLDWEKYMCFDRQGRFGPYGYVEVDGESEIRPEIHWESVNWGALQEHCLHKNIERFDMRDKGLGRTGRALGWLSKLDRSYMKRRNLRRQDASKGETPRPDPNRVPPPPVANRTAVLVRARYDTVYRENDIHNIRALVNELSLKTGGEYQVYLLVEVEDCDDKTWTNKALYDAVVEKSVPKEFIEIAHIYSPRLLRSWYPKMPSAANVDGNVLEKLQWLPIQRFAHLNPSFAYYWNWDLNVRFTGHYYDLVSSLPRFAQKQPRKCLWERNERLYIPSFHGPYETAFRDKVEAESDRDAIVWGAPVIPEFQQHGPRPPPELAQNEHFVWGVGEKADLITLFPIYNPVNTTWKGRDDVWGYKLGTNLPRRATAGTFSVASKLLLDLMHNECLEGRFLNNEMAAPTVALLHSLKAVYAPNPIWFQENWKGEDLQKYFNTGPRSEVGSSQKSVYSGGRKEMFWEGSSFDASAKMAAKVWENWMARGQGAVESEQKHGRMCLPPMLLFPIKDTSTPVWEYADPADLQGKQQ